MLHSHLTPRRASRHHLRDVPRARRTATRPVTCRAEPLETRRLLSATLSLSGTQDIIPGAMVDAGGTTHGTTDQSEMTLSVNPANPLQIAGFSHTFNSPIDVELFYSNDGGNTWASNVIDNADDGLSDAVFRFDPAVIFDANGHLYVSYGHDTGAGRQLRCLRSDNGGATFVQSTQVDTGSGLDKWEMTSGPRVNGSGQVIGQAVYIGYRNPAGSIIVAGSDDNGVTFTRSAKINDQAIDGTNFAFPAVGPDGAVYVSWHDHDDGLVRVDHDADGLQGGWSFGTDVTARTLLSNVIFYKPPAMPDRGIWNAPTLAADRSGGAHNGRVYLTFADRDVGGGDNFDTFLTVSDDHGATWINPNTGTAGALRVENPSSTEFNPWVSVDQTSGLMGITYYSSQIDSDGGNNDVGFRIASSIDGGSTFAFDYLSGTNTSNETGGNINDYGEYAGLVLHAGTAQGFWSFRHGAGTDLDPMTARASFNSSTNGNVLTVNGDDGGVVRDDTIELRLSSVNSAYLEVVVNNVVQYAGLLATIDTINVDGKAGNDRIILNFANGNLLAGVSASITGGTGTDVVEATADQNMTLTNTLLTVGTFGSATLATIEGATLTGGASANTLDATSFTAGSVQLIGLGGNDTLIGGSGDDGLEGGAGNDSLKGGNGGDTYIWSGSVSLGSDTVDEIGTNTGNPDIFDFRSLASTVSLNLSVSTAQTVSTLLTLTLTATATGRVENVTTSQLGAYGDYITGNSLNNRIETWDGADNVYGGWGNDTLYGGAGNDTMIGELDSGKSSPLGNDLMYGDGGNDLMYGDNKNADFSASSYANGNDTMYGGAGDDTMQGDALLGSMANDGDDVMYGEDDNDTMWGDTGSDYDPTSTSSSYGDDILVGGKGNDTLRGQEGNDRYFWSSAELGPSSQTDTLVEYSVGGSDTLDFSNVTQVVTLDLSSTATSQTVIASLLVLSFPAGSSAQYFENASGGSAADTITGNSSFNLLHGNGGSDTLNGLGNVDWMYGDDGDDTLKGGAGNDSVFGGNGNDSVDGEADDDKVFGDADNDQVFGGTGNDTMNGGTGTDTFSDSNGTDRFEASGDPGAGDIIIGSSVGDTVIKDADDTVL